MTDAELNTALTAALTHCETTWAAWEVVRDAGETDLRCPAFQAHNVAQRAVGPLHSEIGRREMARKLAMFAQAPMSGAKNDAAWMNGPGSDAL